MRAVWKHKQKYLQRRQAFSIGVGEKISRNKIQKDVQVKDT